MYYNRDCLGNCTFIVLTFFFLNNAIDVMAKNHAIAQLCSKLRLPVLDTTMNQARGRNPSHLIPLDSYRGHVKKRCFQRGMVQKISMRGNFGAALCARIAMRKPELETVETHWFCCM